MYIQMGSEATRIWNLYMRNVVHIMIMAIKQLILQNDMAIRCVLSVWMFYYYPTGALHLCPCYPIYTTVNVVLALKSALELPMKMVKLPGSTT